MNQRPPELDVPLHDLAVEQELLGALLLHNVNFDVVAGKLQPEHFFEPLHQVIFAEIARKIDLGEPATPLTVRGVLPANIDIAGMSGKQYLARMAAEATIGMNVPYFADTTMQYKAAREHMLNARYLRDECLGGIPIDEALKVFHDQFEAIRNGYLGPGLRDTTRSIADTMYATNERMTAAVSKDPTALGIPTGLVDLDVLIGGLHRGNLMVVAGRPGMGKSSFMVSVSRQIAEHHKYGVGIMSLEMDEVSIGSRMATDRAYDPRDRIAYNSMINGSILPKHQQTITDAAFHLRALPIELDFATSMTVAEVAGSARRMAAKLAKRGVGLDVLMIDYLKFIKATSRYAGQKHYEIGEITAALKALAKTLNCCVVLFHQLNREVEKTADRRPGMEHLRESGDVEQDADVVILLYREAYYIDRSGDLHRDEGDPKKVEAEAKLDQVGFDLDLIVAKQRMGPAKDVRVFCDIGSSVVRSPWPAVVDAVRDR